MAKDREHTRYAHEVAVTFHVGARSFQGRTRNVSRGGLCATMADAIALGTDVELEITLVFDNDMQSDALRLPARVAWCTTVDEAYQIGVSFRPLGTELTEFLTVFLGYLDDSRAEKSPRNLPVDDRFR